VSDRDAYTDEMGSFLNLSDRDIDRLFSGKAPAGEEEFDNLAVLLGNVANAYAVAPEEAIEVGHIATIVEAAQLFADKGEPVVRPASKAHGPGLQASGLPKLRGKLMLSGLFSNMIAKVTAGTIVVMATTGSLAVAGTLPDPVQDAVAEAADTVGISLPDPDDALEEDDVLEDDVEGRDPEEETATDDADDDSDGPGGGNAAANEEDTEDTEDTDDAAGNAGNGAGNAANAEKDTDDSEDTAGAAGAAGAGAQGGAADTASDDQGGAGQGGGNPAGGNGAANNAEDEDSATEESASEDT
jgi:hypothetical protein